MSLAKIPNNSLFYCCWKGRPAGRPARRPAGCGVEVALNVSLGMCAFGFLGIDASRKWVHVRASSPWGHAGAASHPQLLGNPGHREGLNQGGGLRSTRQR